MTFIINFLFPSIVFQTIGKSIYVFFCEWNDIKTMIKGMAIFHFVGFFWLSIIENFLGLQWRWNWLPLGLDVYDWARNEESRKLDQKWGIKKTGPELEKQENWARNEESRKLDQKWGIKKTGPGLENQENWTKFQKNIKYPNKPITTLTNRVTTQSPNLLPPFTFQQQIERNN